jgi:hypothetical protein
MPLNLSLMEAAQAASKYTMSRFDPESVDQLSDVSSA